MTTPTTDNLISEIIEELRPLPRAQRLEAANACLNALDEDDRICTWTPDLAPSQSPDRVDALVHAVTELMIRRIPLKIWV